MRIKAIYAYTIRYLKTISRDKQSLFWIIAWPIFWIILGSYVFIPPTIGKPITLDVGIINNDNSNTPFNGTTFTYILNQTSYNNTKLFNVRIYHNNETLINDVRIGDLDLGIIIPEDFGINTIYRQSTLYVYISGGDIQKAQISKAIITQVLNSLSKNISDTKIAISLKYIGNITEISMPFNDTDNMEWIKNYLTGMVEPIKILYKEVVPPTYKSRETIIGWFTLGAIGMTMLYTGFSIGSLMAVEEKEWGTLGRILSTPSTPSEMILGKSIGGIIILGLTSVLSLVVGHIIGGRIIWDPTRPADWLVIIIFIFLALFTIGFGAVISIFTDTVSGAGGVSIILGLLLAFTTGIWIPKWTLPWWMQLIGDYFPAAWGIEAIRDIVVYRKGIGDVFLRTLYLGLSGIILYGIGIMIYNKLIRKYVER